MAQRVQIVLTDDLDGGKADGTITFGYDGTSYEIDLSDANRAVLQESLAPYIAAARRVAGGRGRTAAAKRKSASGASATEIRAWAVAQGMKVSARGRVSSEVREAYESAHR